MDLSNLKPLKLKFFRQDTVSVARQLVGKYLIHKTDEGVAGGCIVEVEAYLGQNEGDPASHAHRGPTPRSQIMFEAGGISYVYFTYGVHHCVNVVTGPKGQGGAVLIRALEPIFGVELMRKRRKQKDLRALCSGPGKLCQALDINLKQNGLELIGSPLQILQNPLEESADLESTVRIGISKAKDLPFRFVLKNTVYASK